MKNCCCCFIVSGEGGQRGQRSGGICVGDCYTELGEIDKCNCLQKKKRTRLVIEFRRDRKKQRLKERDKKKKNNNPIEFQISLN